MEPDTVLSQVRQAVTQAAQTVNCRNLPINEQFFCVARGWRVTLVEHLPNIVIALIVLALALFLDVRVQRAVERVVGLRNGHRELARLLGRMARAAVLIVALLIVVSIFQWYAIVTSFVASLGIAGLVIAFALQDITKNFAAGVLLLLLRPFRLDDRIKVKDFEGVVQDISLRATTLLTSDGEEVLVPNADVYTSPITNLTRYARRRYHLSLTVPASLPTEPIRQRLEAALRETPGLEQEPAPEVIVADLTADTVTFDARYWLPSKTPNAPEIRTAVIEQLHPLIERIKAQAKQQQAPAQT